MFNCAAIGFGDINSEGYWRSHPALTPEGEGEG